MVTLGTGCRIGRKPSGVPLLSNWWLKRRGMHARGLKQAANDEHCESRGRSKKCDSTHEH